MALNRFGNMVKNTNDKLRNKITDSLVNDVKDLRNDEFKSQMAANKKKADNQALWNKYKKTGEKIDIPEFDAKVVDLPKEDVNEKEIVVDRNPAQKPFSVQGPTNEQLYDLEALAGNGLPVEEETSPDDATVVGETPIENTLGDTNNDNTTVEETPITEEPQDDTFDESQVVEPEGWDAPDVPTDEEINQPTEEEKPKATSFYMPKSENEEWDLEDLAGNGQREEPKKEEPPAENKDKDKKEESPAEDEDKYEKENKDSEKEEEEEEEEKPKEKEKVKTDAADVKDNTDLVKKGSGVSVDDIVNRAGIPHYNYLSFFN